MLLTFGVNELFYINVTGIVTARDSLVVDFDMPRLVKRMKDFVNPNRTDNEVRDELFGHKKEGKYLAGDSRGWKLSNARKTIALYEHEDIVQPITYRPFDSRFIYYTPAMVDWGREKIMRHFFEPENMGMMVCKQQKSSGFTHVLAHRGIIESSYVSNRTSEIGYSFPLWLYDGGLLKTKTPNLDGMIWEKIKRKVGKAAEDPQAVFDYVYAVLHAPSYRSTYAEFLKSDFPRIPYPTGTKQFEAMVALGAELRQLHLLEHPACNKLLTTYPMDGSHMVEKVSYADGKVWINAEQYFEGVPAVAWEFYIGGYQPAQKWLKDRRGRELTLEDITHYQRIIATLAATAAVMARVDEVYEK